MSTNDDSRKVMEKKEASDLNRDPISGTPGAHPIGTGLGAAAGGAVAGAAVGSVAGPVGTVVGGAVGAIVGGLAGKAAGEAVNPTVEETYWRETYVRAPYYDTRFEYIDYAPAYRLGWEARARLADRTWDQSQSELQSDWERVRGQSRLIWAEAEPATRAAWERVDQERRSL